LIKSLNQLEAEVKQKLQVERIKAELKLDGLFFDKRYADLMMLVISKELDKSVLDMSAHYLELKVFLEELSQYPEEIMNEEHQVFPSEPRLYGTSLKTNHRTKRDYKEIRCKLHQSDSFDETELYPRIKEASKVMLCKLTDYMRDHLPGGKYWEPPEDVKQILDQLKPHNDACESALGMNDWLTTAFPRMTQQARSALIEMASNQTIEWLKMQVPECQDEIIALAASKRREVIKERELNRERLIQQQITQRETELQKGKMKADKEAKERQKLEQEVLYKTASELDEAIDDIQAMPISQSAKRRKTLELVKTQLRIRSKLLRQTSASKIKFTINKKQRPIGELVRDLKSVILQETKADDLQSTVESIRVFPSKLVKKCIKHKFFDEDCQSEQWYEGQVLSFSESTKNYCIKYNGEETACFFTVDEILEDILARDFVVM
jgi:hypothetical protein